MTGIGLVSSVGIGTEATWESLLAGRSGIGPITRFDAAAFSTRFAAEVKAFDPLQFVEKKEVKKMDIFIQFAIAASQFAMDDSGLKVTPDIAPRVGVFIASGIGGFTTIEREHKAFLEGGPRKISPFFIPILIIPANRGSALGNTLFQPDCVDDLWSRLAALIPRGGERMIFAGMNCILQAEFDGIQIESAGDFFHMTVKRPVSLWDAVATERACGRRVGVHHVCIKADVW